MDDEWPSGVGVEHVAELLLTATLDVPRWSSDSPAGDMHVADPLVTGKVDVNGGAVGADCRAFAIDAVSALMSLVTSFDPSEDAWPNRSLTICCFTPGSASDKS